MKPRVLVIMNDPISPLGRLADHMEEDGIVPTIYEPYRLSLPPPIDRFDILFILGGRMDVWEEQRYPWLAHEKEMIRKWVLVDDKPTLGICLGHQLIAAALGGSVGKSERGEARLTEVTFTVAGCSHAILKGLSGSTQAIC